MLTVSITVSLIQELSAPGVVLQTGLGQYTPVAVLSPSNPNDYQQAVVTVEPGGDIVAIANGTLLGAAIAPVQDGALTIDYASTYAWIVNAFGAVTDPSQAGALLQIVGSEATGSVLLQSYINDLGLAENVGAQLVGGDPFPEPLTSTLTALTPAATGLTPPPP